MDDLIRRSDAIEAIEEVDWWHQNRNKDMVSGANSAEHQAWYKADDVYKALEAAPSADKRGEWKHLKGDEWLCSNCGYVVWTEGSWEHPLERGKDYCEHCGARMKGADDE